MDKSNRIPSESEFAFAKKKVTERLALEAKIRDRIFSSIPQDLPCHDIWVWVSDPKTTVSYVYPKDSDLVDHEQTGTKARVEEIVREVASFLGNIELVTEHHSHEHVLKKFNGNYGKYFR